MLAVAVAAYVCACVYVTLRRVPVAGSGGAALAERLRARGVALLCLPLSLLAFESDDDQVKRALLVVFLAGLVVVFAPGIARKAAPFGLLALGFYGFLLTNYLVYPGATWIVYQVGENGGVHGHLLLPETAFFVGAGLWLLVRTGGPGSGFIRAVPGQLLSRTGPVPPWLLPPVVVLVADLLSTQVWDGKNIVPTLAVLAVAVVAAIVVPRIAAIIAVLGLLVVGAYGVLIPLVWPVSDPARLYGLVIVDSTGRGILAAAQGLLLLFVAWRLAPRLAIAPDAELTQRVKGLSQRVQRLTQTRSDATDTAAAELRRIERNLHDGAQARLVALGMSLRAAEQMMLTSPEAARALVAEARETSSRALTDLRDLVRGIYPPVLADRGLGDAVHALALDTPLPVEVDVDLPREVEMPVAASVYFAIAEALTNAVRHSGARKVQIRVAHAGGHLRAEIIDDGSGGADPAAGTGLAGVERRLATFDGILAVNSPLGGPTIVVIEVPCALSSPKISSS
jgi:signal transduction histidine kinase